MSESDPKCQNAASSPVQNPRRSGTLSMAFGKWHFSAPHPWGFCWTSTPFQTNVQDLVYRSVVIDGSDLPRFLCPKLGTENVF